MKTLLTDRFLKSLKPTGRRQVIWDTSVPSFCVIASAKGKLDYAVIRRLPGARTPITRRVGSYPITALAEAREAARRALADMSSGVDPAAKRRAEQEAARAAARLTFDAAANDFLADHVAKLRSADAVRTAFERYLFQDFSGKQLAAITDDEIVKLLKHVSKKGGPSMARHLYAYLNKFFRWAIAQRCYGVRHSPCAEISIKDLFGSASHRERVLDDAELRSLWTAAAAIGYPGGRFIQTLILTGARRTEAAQMTWPELDSSKRVWTVPPTRTKSGRAHIVPLSSTALEIFDSMPRWDCPFVFSSLGGRRPISGYGSLKKKLDSLMPGIEPWAIHDIRRTVRTRLSSLRIPDHIAELVIGHTKKGLIKVYDQYSYELEKRDALETWARYLMQIVEPDDTGKVLRLTTA